MFLVNPHPMKENNLKKTRSQIRNERAELVCRELRFQIGGKQSDMDLNKVTTLLIGWMKVTGKIKYKRP